MGRPRWIWTVVAGLLVLAFAVAVMTKIARDRDAAINGSFGAIPASTAPSTCPLPSPKVFGDVSC